MCFVLSLNYVKHPSYKDTVNELLVTIKNISTSTLIKYKSVNLHYSCALRDMLL